MNRDVERSLYEMAGTAGTHEVVVRIQMVRPSRTRAIRPGTRICAGKSANESAPASRASCTIRLSKALLVCPCNFMTQ